jgi:hypothetical protein
MTDTSRRGRRWAMFLGATAAGLLGVRLASRRRGKRGSDVSSGLQTSPNVSSVAISRDADAPIEAALAKVTDDEFQNI